MGIFNPDDSHTNNPNTGAIAGVSTTSSETIAQCAHPWAETPSGVAVTSEVIVCPPGNGSPPACDGTLSTKIHVSDSCLWCPESLGQIVSGTNAYSVTFWEDQAKCSHVFAYANCGGTGQTIGESIRDWDLDSDTDSERVPGGDGEQTVQD